MTQESIPENQCDPPTVMEFVSVYAALFASLTTLVCCALPALLVLLGFGLVGVLTFFTAIPGWESFGVYETGYFAVPGRHFLPGAPGPRDRMGLHRRVRRVRA